MAKVRTIIIESRLNYPGHRGSSPEFTGIREKIRRHALLTEFGDLLYNKPENKKHTAKKNRKNPNN